VFIPPGFVDLSKEHRTTKDQKPKGEDFARYEINQAFSHAPDANGILR
jgi:hypothetical protein